MNRQDNIFILQDEQGRRFVYMPLQDYFTQVQTDKIDNLPANVLAHANTPAGKIHWTKLSSEGLLNLMVLPNNKCNFQCSYCYSALGRSNEEISSDILRAGIRYFLSPERLKGRKATVSILGGGEPLMSWHLIRPALEYAYNIYGTHEQPLNVSIVTNCSLIDCEFISFCKTHNIFVTASFDILQDIQNKHRSQFNRVQSNIIHLAQEAIPVDITTVVTSENIERMEEMVDAVHQYLPNISRISFRYIMSDTYFSDENQRFSYYKHFIDNFFLAQEKAERYGLTVTCPYQNLMSYLTDRHCPGKFVITPSGFISTCFYVSSPKDHNFKNFLIGKINPTGKVEVNEQKLKNILSYNKNSKPECSGCPAQWHCAGGCFSDNCIMTTSEKNAYCKSMRYFLIKYLIKKHKLL